MIGKRYLARLTTRRARARWRINSRDILALFGAKSLVGTHLLRPSGRLQDSKEDLVMDPTARTDYVTRFNSLSIEPRFRRTARKLHSLATPRVHLLYLSFQWMSGFAIL